MQEIKRAYNINITTEKFLYPNQILITARWIEYTSPGPFLFDYKPIQLPPYKLPEKKEFAFIMAEELLYNCTGHQLREALMTCMSPLLLSDIPELVCGARNFIEKAVYEHEAIYQIKVSLGKPDEGNLSDMSHYLPGIDAMVAHPVNGECGRLRSVIMSLNDTYKWTREQIADWIDEISDPSGESGPDIRFQIKENHEQD